MTSITADIKDQPYWQKGPIALTCVNRIDLTSDVTSFQFVSEPRVKFHFKPGQFIALQLKIDGKKVIRSYTVSSSPSRPYLLEMTIKRDPQGIASQWIHNNIQIGSELNARGPNGVFNCWDTPSTKALMITAGSGITPCMSMVRWWIDTAANTDVVFFHSATTTADIIFSDELSQYDRLHSNFSLAVACTRPTDTDQWHGLTGRFNQSMLDKICPDFQQRTIYCCGPAGFMDSVKEILNDNNFPMENYFDESFGGGLKRAKPAAKKTAPPKETTKEATVNFPDIEVPRGMFGLHCAQSEKTIIMDENDLILEKANSEGVFIDSACQSGNCGTCQVKKISGNVETENNAGLNEDSAKQGYILTCTTRLKSNTVLDI